MYKEQFIFHLRIIIVATKLILYTDTVDFSLPRLTQSRIAAASHRDDKFAVYSNPAEDKLKMQVTGTVVITITKAAGKLMLAKTVTNNSLINVIFLAPGIYYIQNQTTGEVKKIVLSH